MTGWAEVRRIFEHVVELPPADRAAQLHVLCRNDADLRSEVERLLAQDSSTSAPAIDSPVNVQLALPDPTRLRQIGSYKLLRLLGSGGMGMVFEAEQQQPSRRVALKVLRTLVASESARRRFAYEAESLGRLSHPNVAQIHESGTWQDPDTGEQLPFFAMELVTDALPLTRFADARNLDLRARLRLVLQVCEAVQHGHQQGIMHRDLKPANVLVNDDGQIKVIDFGIARAIGAADEQRSAQTLNGQVLGTPGYMSPEQLDGDPARVDVRADVYGLGSTLYDLLVGHAPHDQSTDSLGQFLQRVRNQAPPRPSTVATAPVALPTEVDWLLLKALAAEPNERYATVSDLAADIRRFLAEQPLVARPPTRSYLLHKFVRRHRLPVAASVSVALALIIGTIATSLGWSRAVAAEELADNRRQTAEQLADELAYLSELQGDILQGSRGDKNTLLVDVLERASTRLTRDPPQNDRVAAGLYTALARAFLDLGLTERSQQHFDAALQRIDDGPAMLRTSILVRSNYARLLYELGQLDEAEQIRRKTLRQNIELYGEDHRHAAWGRLQLANVLQERAQYGEVITLMRRALPILQSDPQVESYQVTSALTVLANALARNGQPEDADRHYQAAIARATDDFGAEDPETLSIRNSHATLLLDTGRIEHAEPLFETLWHTLEHVRGPAHASTVRVATNYALCAEKRQAYADAERIYRQVLKVRKDAGAKLTISDLVTRFNLCVALHRQPGEAKLTAALTELDTLLDDATKMLPEDNWRLAVFRQHHGIALRKCARFGEAEAAFALARQVLEQRLGATNSRTQSNYEETARLYEEWGKPDVAKQWREKLTGK